MKINDLKIRKDFLSKWILATSIAWPVGLILAIILSYAVVNLFYPKETNLIVGLCLGAAVGFAQWLVLKKFTGVGSWWILSSALGVGIISAIIVLLEETEIINPDNLTLEYIMWFLVACFGGFLNGVLQIPSFRKMSKYSGRWVVVSTISWGISMLTYTLAGGFGFMLGGVLLGCATGFSFVWLVNFSELK